MLGASALTRQELRALPAAQTQQEGSGPAAGSSHWSPVATTSSASHRPARALTCRCQADTGERVGGGHGLASPALWEPWVGLRWGLFADLQRRRMGPGGGAREDRGSTEGSLLRAWHFSKALHSFSNPVTTLASSAE